MRIVITVSVTKLREVMLISEQLLLMELLLVMVPFPHQVPDSESFAYSKRPHTPWQDVVGHSVTDWCRTDVDWCRKGAGYMTSIYPPSPFRRPKKRVWGKSTPFGEINCFEKKNTSNVCEKDVDGTKCVTKCRNQNRTDVRFPKQGGKLDVTGISVFPVCTPPWSEPQRWHEIEIDMRSTWRCDVTAEGGRKLTKWENCRQS
jgi:hypothetical protein